MLYLILDEYVMRAAFHDGDGRDERQARLLLQFGNRKRTAVAHRGADFGERLHQIVVQGAGVRNVAVNAFDEGNQYAHETQSG